MAGKKAATSFKPSQGTAKGTSTKKSAKTKPTEDDAPSSTKLKPANAVNCRHILVASEKKQQELNEKIKDGARFDEVEEAVTESKREPRSCCIFARL